MSNYYGMRVTKKEFKELINNESIIYKLSTDNGLSIGFMSAGKLVEDGKGYFNNNTKIIKSKIVDSDTIDFDRYYLAK